MIQTGENNFAWQQKDDLEKNDDLNVNCSGLFNNQGLKLNIHYFTKRGLSNKFIAGKLIFSFSTYLLYGHFIMELTNAILLSK